MIIVLPQGLSQEFRGLGTADGRLKGAKNRTITTESFKTGNNAAPLEGLRRVRR